MSGTRSYPNPAVGLRFATNLRLVAAICVSIDRLYRIYSPGNFLPFDRIGRLSTPA